MILSATLSKPTASVEAEMGKPYEKIKIKIENSSQGTGYFAEMFTKTQVFHQHFSEQELNEFLSKHAGTTFKNCVKRTEAEEITIMANKKGKVTELVRPIRPLRQALRLRSGQAQEPLAEQGRQTSLKNLPSAKKKNYLLQEGVPVPFLVMLGIMTPEGKVVNSKYDKFRQINRFLEFIDDVLPAVVSPSTGPSASLRTSSGSGVLRIADFGCGKSYLTFAVHYFLTEIKHIPCEIEGLDLKEDVIKYCNDMAKKLNLKGLIFHTGNIADYSGEKSPDIVITLHACDTATDFALKYAVEKGAKAILSVPCCQHQINQQLQKQGGQTSSIPEEFEPLLKWGIIREKFSSLVTDALRGEWLESQGYKVQMLEFIDMEHTPKNILIRAVKNKKANSKIWKSALIDKLNITPEII